MLQYLAFEDKHLYFDKPNTTLIYANHTFSYTFHGRRLSIQYLAVCGIVSRIAVTYVRCLVKQVLFLQHLRIEKKQFKTGHFYC